MVLIDTGIGLQDIAKPLERIGQQAIEAAGYQFHERLTAARQIEALGFQVRQVTDIILTHGDPDHAGGLADFPEATVHVAAEERAQITSGHLRYSPAQFDHQPRWVAHAPSSDDWFGLEGRPLPLGEGIEVRLVPLFGHTHGHCGVAVGLGDRWLLHAGDAYYLRVELFSDDHPVSKLAALRADDNARRCHSLAALRRLIRDHSSKVEVCGYHDFQEFPRGMTSVAPEMAHRPA